MLTDFVPDDRTLRELLTAAQNIAVIGHSEKPHRTSYQIAGYLRRAGYRVFPVNPTVSRIDGQPSYPSLHDLPVPIDIVNVFRRSEHVSDIVMDAIAAEASAIWTQLDVVDVAAGKQAHNAGLVVVMNRCIKVEHARLNI